MISIEILQSIKLVCNIGYQLGSIPFIWDERQRKIIFTKSRWKLRHCCIIALYSICNSIFMGIRVFQGIYSLKVPYSILTINLLNVVTWLASSAFQVNTLIYYKDIEEFINQFMDTLEQFECKFLVFKFTTWS